VDGMYTPELDGEGDTDDDAIGEEGLGKRRRRLSPTDLLEDQAALGGASGVEVPAGAYRMIVGANGVRNGHGYNGRSRDAVRGDRDGRVYSDEEDRSDEDDRHDRAARKALEGDEDDESGSERREGVKSDAEGESDDEDAIGIEVDEDEDMDADADADADGEFMDESMDAEPGYRPVQARWAPVSGPGSVFHSTSGPTNVAGPEEDMKPSFNPTSPPEPSSNMALYNGTTNGTSNGGSRHNGHVESYRGHSNIYSSSSQPPIPPKPHRRLTTPSAGQPAFQVNPSHPETNLGSSSTAMQGGQIQMQVRPQGTFIAQLHPPLAILQEQPQVLQGTRKKGKRNDGQIPEYGFVPREYVYREKE